LENNEREKERKGNGGSRREEESKRRRRENRFEKRKRNCGEEDIGELDVGGEEDEKWKLKEIARMEKRKGRRIWVGKSR